MILLYLITVLPALLTLFFFRKLHPIFKPIPILILSAFSLASFVDTRESFFLIIAALFVTSAVGDVLLANGYKRFIYGLLFFLTTHILLISIFLILKIEINILILTTLLISNLTIITIINMKSTSQKTTKIMTIIYTIVISIMAGFSFSTKNLFIMSGAGFFLLSDALLSYDVMIKKFKYTEIFILTTYYTAQILLFYGLIKTI